jgi:uncharacterized membrane protein
VRRTLVRATELVTDSVEAYVVIVLLVLAAPLVLAIWLIARAIAANRSIEELTRRLWQLESEVLKLKSERESGGPLAPGVLKAAAPTPTPAPTPISSQPEPIRPTPVAPLAPTAARASVGSIPPAMAAPPPAPAPAASPPLVPTARPVAVPLAASAAVPPPLPTAARQATPEAPRPTGVLAQPSINWEQFIGVKLFAWIGGLFLFLGVAYFVKYSFDNNLVPPELRVAIGFVTGLGLLVGGVILSRRDYAVLAHTLCGAGVVILYAATFACRSIYHFDWFGLVPAFLLMILITATAFFVAVRLNALVVAVLGILGGFLTPILLSTGQDNPFGLFGYIAILDAGLILVALHRRWPFLAALGAAGTVFMQIGWASEFFTREKYFEGDKIFTALAVILVFNALYLAASWWARRRSQLDWWLAGSTLGLAAVALAFAAWFLSFEPLALRPWLMFGFVFLVDLGVHALVLLDTPIAPAQPCGGLVVFGLLGLWTMDSLKSATLNAGLAYYLVFAVAHSLFPLWLQRYRGDKAPFWGSQIFPALALVLVLVPIFRLPEVSFVVWPFVLLVDVLAIGLAIVTASMWTVLVVLLLTLAATGALILKIPMTLVGLETPLVLIGLFAVFFLVAGVWLARRFKPDALKGAGVEFGADRLSPGDLATQLPVLSSVLPFLLLIMATARLPLQDPSPVFGLALLLVVLMLGVTRVYSFEWLPAVGLACVAGLECTWHFNRFDSSNAVLPLVWYLVFLAAFSVFPFLCLRQFSEKVVPWAAAALAGPAQFFLVHRLMKAAYPNPVMGLLPLAFAVPPLAGLAVILKKHSAQSAARLTQLAWFGGIALFFITLSFPIQFDREWITIGWALEGAALLWLFHRVPHAGLRLAGVGLLIAAFVRLTFNPAVFEYHPRTATPILNWYLYAYGLVTVSLFAGAALLAPPRNKVLGSNTPPVLAGLGTVLAFLLLNIEIADYFSPPGSTLTFQFSGNFARDMTYSIAWALFALMLLVIGILRRLRALRYAGLGLLSVTLLKLFFHDLAQLEQLYRIGALIGVAVIAMVASFAYQRFFAANLREKEPSDVPAGH